MTRSIKIPVLLAADTIVVYAERIIGKPRGREDAIQTLTDLSGKKHTGGDGCGDNERRTGNCFF